MEAHTGLQIQVIVSPIKNIRTDPEFSGLYGCSCLLLFIQTSAKSVPAEYGGIFRFTGNGLREIIVREIISDKGFAFAVVNFRFNELSFFSGNTASQVGKIILCRQLLADFTAI